MIEKVVLGAAAPLIAIAIFVALVLPSLGGESGTPQTGSPTPGSVADQATDGRIEGDPIVCGGGASTLESIERSGDKFRVVGQLMEREGDAARISGPEGDVMVMLVPPANQATGFIVGDFVIVSGSVDEDGVGTATEFAPVCQGDTFVQEPIVNPTPGAAPAPNPSEAPLTPATTDPAPTQDDNDGEDDDSEERGNRRHGNSSNSGHGNDDGDDKHDKEDKHDEDDDDEDEDD